MMDRVVLSELLPGTVVMFELVPLAVAIFLVIWRLHLPQIAIVVQVVEIVTPFHR